MNQASQHLLGGWTVAILAANGVEQSELTGPRDALLELGVEARLLSPTPGRIRSTEAGQPGAEFDVDMALDKADPDAYDAILLPGGADSVQRLCTHASAQAFVQAFDREGKPVGVLCHGTALLVAAGLVRGRRLAGPDALRGDIDAAGGQWVDESVVVDRNWVSSRRLADVAAFNECLPQLMASQRGKTMVGTADDLSDAA